MSPDSTSSQPATATDVARTIGLGISPARRWLSWRRLLAMFVVVVAAVGAYLVAFPGGDADPQVKYVTENLRRGPLTQTVTATGTVEPTNKVEISSELSGTIRSVAVDFNDRVSTGQVLAVLDTGKLEAELSHSRASLVVRRAQLQEAQATLEEARLALERTRALSERDFASRATRESAEATHQRATAGVAVARANIEVAEADLLTAETNLAKATIRSPIDGVVMSRSVELGQTVAASLQAPVLFTLAEDLAAMQLEVDIDEADVGQVREGQTAVFTVDAWRDRRFPAEVTMVRVAPEVINNVVTYTAVLSLDNSELLLRPGMTATVDIVVNEVPDALLMPNAALRFAPPADEVGGSGGGILGMLIPRPRGGGSDAAKVAEEADGRRTVYRLDKNEPLPVVIRVGVSDGAFTEVIDGDLAAGTVVIVDSVTAR